MTDKQIEVCLNYILTGIQCREFIVLPPSERGLLIEALEDALALINRQQAEIERLKEDNFIKSQKRANIFEIVNAHEKGRAEAIKSLRRG